MHEKIKQIKQQIKRKTQHAKSSFRRRRRRRRRRRCRCRRVAVASPSRRRRRRCLRRCRRRRRRPRRRLEVAVVEGTPAGARAEDLRRGPVPRRAVQRS